MKKKCFVKVLFTLAMMTGVFLKLSAQTNVALTATASTSYVSSWETLSAVNDDSNPSNSNDKSSGAYGNWNNPNSIQWVQYDWSSNQTITKTEVYWFDDNGGVLSPTTAYVEYWNGSSWINVGDVPKVKDAWNSLNINNVTTSRFRISMLNTSQSTGILEWRVWDNSGSCTPSTITPYTQIDDGSWNQTASATVDEGGKVIFGPQPTSGGSWSWSGPSGFSASTREITIDNIQTNQAGTYTAVYTNDCGAQTTQNFTITVNGTSTATNIALIATASTSYVSSWETLSAVNDDSNPSSSNDKSSGAYGNWDNPNSIQWVQYDWSSNYNITKTEVYWFDDNGGVLTPTTAYVEYWNGSSWINCGDVPTVKDAWNILNISNVTTNRFRISMLNTSQSTGILEWRVWGTPAGGGSDTQAPTTPGTPSASNITSSSCTLSWTASTDNVGVTGYQVLRNGSPIMTVTNTSANVSGLSAGTTYSFTVKAYDATGNYSSASGAVSVTTSSGSGVGDPYTWPSYNPTISYDFRDEFPGLSTPTQILDDCPQVVGTQSDRWWCFRWGPNANSLVTSAAITPMLQRLNTDFAYFRDEMGWPPDLRAKNGYRSSVYLYGSGLCTDNASNTDLGGWQSAIYYNGQNWPMILASYYPVYSFDPACSYSDKSSQQGAMVHEGIHAVLADLPGVKQAAWFHEGGNVWLQQTAEARRSNSYSSLGDLNGTDFIAPFMPVECYSGWLQDGSFGGPSAEGVDMFNGSQQICTWRTYLGGHQYSSSFPTFLGNALGDGAVPWIWRNAAGRVLEGIASGIGEQQTRRLITEYRAKQALIDFGPWNSAIIALMNAHFGQTIQAEWQPSWLNPDPWTATPYVQTTNNGSGLLTPEYRTTPGWSGANQIPLNVTGNLVTVNFQPIGANMTCQLVYRSTDGTAVYSEPVSSGDCSIRLDLPPANNVVIAVITNTDYIYYGESTRTAHYDYRLQLVTGVTGTADIHTRWYNLSNLKSTEVNNSTPAFDASKYCSHNFRNKGIVGGNIALENMNDGTEFLMYPNPVSSKDMFMLEFDNSGAEQITIEITNIQGQVVFEAQTRSNNYMVNLNNLLSKGVYLVTIRNSTSKTTQKLMIQ